MKFLPTVNLWDPAISDALHRGQLKLQRGQWCVCGAGNNPSRFVKNFPGGSIWVAHWEGEKRKTNDSFKRLCKAAGELTQPLTTEQMEVCE